MQKERPAGRLTLRSRPQLNTELAGHGSSEDIIAAAMPLYNELEADARMWIIRGGWVERGPITKRDAENMWRAHLAKVGAE